MQTRDPLDLHGDATGFTASWARREFTAWLAVDVAAGELFDDLVLVMYEAMVNAADHAYIHTETGTVRLLARRCPHEIQIIVSDHGTWRDSAIGAYRGRGLPLMRLLVRDVHIEPGAMGTVVHLRTPLPPPTLAGRPDLRS